MLSAASVAQMRATLEALVETIVMRGATELAIPDGAARIANTLSAGTFTP